MKKNRQYNDQKKKYKRTQDLQNIHIKLNKKLLKLDVCWIFSYILFL